MQKYLDFATNLARLAGEHQLEYYQKKIQTKIKGLNDFVTEADLAIEEMLKNKIREQFPQHKIYSEEKTKDEFEESDWVWIIDPIDGTGNFASGIPFFCVSIALWHRGHVQLGVVHAPVFQETFHAVRGQGAFLNQHPLQARPSPQGRLIMLGELGVRKSAETKLSLQTIQQLTPKIGTMRMLGAMALDLCYSAKLAGGNCFCNAFYPWDIAAGALIAQEAGNLVTDFKSQPWTIYSTTCLAAHPQAHGAFIQALKD